MLDICCLQQLGRPASSTPPLAMINKIFSNSVKKPAGSAGRGVVGPEGAWLDLVVFFFRFLSAQEDRSSSRLLENGCARKIQLLDVKALHAEEKR